MALSIYFFAYWFIGLIIFYVFIVNIVSKYADSEEKEQQLVAITNRVFTVLYICLFASAVGVSKSINTMVGFING